ncbi:ABC transporter ATP-binding protein [Spongiimicrobium salis]|uniref:ABC transporter ATP-binding protein n=1 Tax=Spongiimicrobium salis TaxID=1667022 RepID=UPI00374D2729
MMQLKIHELNKTYGNGVRALRNISLEINSGMFGLLGPNGAGKSSLMRTLATLQEADSGSISLGEIDVLKNPRELRKKLGYLPQEFGVYPKITAKQLLNHMAILKGITPAKKRHELVNFLLDRVNLYEKRHKAVKGFSGGMKQRIGIAQAIMGNPELIIVDEPTAGLDPGERNRFHNLLADIAENVIVILSTHIVEDVKELCPNMAIMNYGQIICKGSPEEVIATLEHQVWQKLISRSELEAYQHEYDVISNKMIGGKPLIHVRSNTKPGADFEAVSPTLEDVFFSKINTSSLSA